MGFGTAPPAHFLSSFTPAPAGPFPVLAAARIRLNFLLSKSIRIQWGAQHQVTLDFNINGSFLFWSSLPQLRAEILHGLSVPCLTMGSSSRDPGKDFPKYQRSSLAILARMVFLAQSNECSESFPPEISKWCHLKHPNLLRDNIPLTQHFYQGGKGG